MNRFQLESLEKSLISKHREGKQLTTNYLRTTSDVLNDDTTTIWQLLLGVLETFTELYLVGYKVKFTIWQFGKHFKMIKVLKEFFEKLWQHLR